MQFISSYPWYFILLCLIAGGVFAGLLYFRDKKNTDRSKGILALLATLRFLSVSIISLLLLEVFVKHLINETEKPIIIIAQDNSASIVAGKDSTDLKVNYIKALNDFKNAVKEKYEVKMYQFDTETQPTETFDFKGKETDISKLVNDIENNYSNSNIGAVILATDGIYNKGTNPFYSVQKINAPFYTIALGDTTPIKDVLIQSVNHNQIAYLGNTFPVEVLVNATDLKGSDVTLTLSNNGTVLKSETVVLNSEAFSKTYSFTVDALKTGIQKYTVSLSTLPEDKNIYNNSQSFIIDVIDNRQKVLILASAPHPDITAIKESISSTQTYEVEVGLINDFTKPLKPYSLIILHQTNSLPPRIINEVKANNQSIWYIGLNPPTGLFSFGMPNSGGRFNDVEPSVNTNFSLFSISNELSTYYKEFPAVKCNFGNINANNGSYTLLNQRIGVVNTDNPLFLFTETNGVKLAGFFGDGLWRWKLRDFLDHDNHNLFNELVNKTVQYLSVKADKSFFRVFTKKIINENEALDFTAEVYNQSYELITEPDVLLTLKDSKGKMYNYTFSKKQTMYSLSAGLFPAGEYSYEAKVKVGDKLFTKSGIVVVKEIVAEKINTLANHQLLFQIAKESGGKLFYKNQLKELQKEILESQTIKSITYSHKQLTDLVNLKWIFFIILFLLSVEWFIRKRNGGI